MVTHRLPRLRRYSITFPVNYLGYTTGTSFPGIEHLGTGTVLHTNVVVFGTSHEHSP